MKRTITDEKNCVCHTCQKFFHYLGVTAHRMAHLKRGEMVEITFTNGNRRVYGTPQQLAEYKAKRNG